MLWEYSDRLRDFIASETRVWKDDMFNILDKFPYIYSDLEYSLQVDTKVTLQFIILAETIAMQVPNSPFNPIFTNLLTVLEN